MCDGIFFVERQGRVVAASTSYKALWNLVHPSQIQWAETIPGWEEKPEEKEEFAPVQTIRSKTVKARPDLLTACHWRG